MAKITDHKNNRYSLIDLLEIKEQELENTKQKLEQIRYKIKEEMDLAKQIQESLIPRELPETANLKTSAVYIPADKIGGDLYDIIVTQRQKIAVLIFDVSGHGIPAALIAAMAKMLFAHYIEKFESPSEVFCEVNKKICHFVKTEQYLTAFLCLIDPVKNSMVYSRAGHVAPLLFESKNRQIARLDSKGFFVGHTALLPIVEYKDETVSLNAGDKILLYTDGVTEGCNSQGNLYGIKRLEQIFMQIAKETPQNVLDSITADHQVFRDGASLRDDFTMLCIEVGDPDDLLKDSGFSTEEKPGVLVLKNMDEIENTCSFILKEMDKNGFEDSSIRQIKICIFEMITNAIIHGNRNDLSKIVKIFYKVSPEAASISVIDEGDGFDYTKLPDPLLPENRIKDHGRGIFIVRHYFDEIEFNEKGNRITGKKYRRKK
ncbi:MAG: SpoIIE family protein phosphatase [Fibrobacter sp.]|nr:SpoIIE family protein phosphatase [Fibrobacter sp.]